LWFVVYCLWFVVCGFVNSHVQGANLKKRLAFGVWRLVDRWFMADSFYFEIIVHFFQNEIPNLFLKG
jgi:hypothetical protein